MSNSVAGVGPSGGATLESGAEVMKAQGEPPSRLAGSSWGDGSVVDRSWSTSISVSLRGAMMIRGLMRIVGPVIVGSDSIYSMLVTLPGVRPAMSPAAAAASSSNASVVIISL